jgi:hypothetical protein
MIIFTIILVSFAFGILYVGNRTLLTIFIIAIIATASYIIYDDFAYPKSPNMQPAPLYPDSYPEVDMLLMAFQEASNDPVIRWFDNLEKLTGCFGMALIWCNEIHMDSHYKTSEMLPDLLAHERKHFYFFGKIATATHSITRLKWQFINNWWDAYDRTRLIIKRDIKRLKRLKSWLHAQTTTEK